MGYCGDKYTHLVRAGARSARRPCLEGPCSEDDWKAWHRRLKSLRADVQTRLAELQAGASEQGRMDVPDEIVSVYLEPADEVRDVALSLDPGPAFPGDPQLTAPIQKGIEALNLYACTLEQLDGGFAQLGLNPPKALALNPSKSRDWRGIAIKGGIAVGVTGLGVLLVRWFRNREGS